MQPDADLQFNGVTLLTGVFPDEALARVKADHDKLDATLTRTEVPTDQPAIVFWRHIQGEKGRVAHFNEFRSLWALIKAVVVPTLRRSLPALTGRLQLLETIIFDKPGEISGALNWHQDVAYFPLVPNNQLAVWIPFDVVTAERGAMQYALGSHVHGLMGSTNLHTREPFAGETRPVIPESPEAEGFEVKTFEMTPRDMLIHDGFTWHRTGPNLIAGHRRRGLSVRFMTSETVFEPRAGQGAAFTRQMQAMGVPAGQIVHGAPFPMM